MANLETLELTIGANSESAVQGIDRLTRSLSALGTAIQAPLKQLSALNEQIKNLRNIGDVKIPKAVGANGISQGSKRGMPISQQEALRLINQASQQDLLYMKAQGMTAEYVSKATSGRLTQKQLAEGAMGIKKITKEITGAGEEAESTRGRMNSFGKTLSQIGRIAKTMLIRTAMRSLMKAFSEAWQSAYKFSKSVGGDFAKSIDNMKGSLQGAAISLISAFAPAISALAPVVNVVARAIKYLCDVIRELLSLLGVSSEMFGATVDQINAAGGASSGAAKNALASFDELNVIASSGGGGGGGGVSTTGLFSNEITEELAKIQAAVGEALIAIGLILAFTGHVPLGVGLIAIGAAALVKTLKNDWGKLTQDTKGEIAKIMTIAAGAFLALGLILAFSGHIGLGVGLIAAGAANLVAVAAISDQLSPQVRSKLTRITAIVGGSLLAVGAILALTGVATPLGLGMMAVGGIALAAAIAPNWNSLSEKVKRVFEPITEWLSEKWEVVTDAIKKAWKTVKKWWEDSGVGEKVRQAWGTVSEFFINLWDDVRDGAVKAWNHAKKWWETNVTENVKKEGVWGGVKGFFRGVFNGIAGLIDKAWTHVLKWMGVDPNQFETAWENVKKEISEKWSSIKTSVNNAWEKVEQWINIRTGDLSNTWETVRTTLVSKWNGIKSSVNDAWEMFLNWKDATWADMKTTWETIRLNLASKWNGIGSTVNTAWEKVQTWMSAKWDSFKKGWNDIREKLSGVWTSIGTYVTSTKTKIKEFWDNTIVGNIKQAWRDLGDWFKTNITDPISRAWNDVKTTIKNVINWAIDGLNGIGTISIPKVAITIPDWLGGGEWQILSQQTLHLWNISRLASGQYDIPRGQLFIANEAGAELIGDMNGHTTVANQEQIIEGISRGVKDGQAEQNALLRQQNSILLQILQKNGNVSIGASSALGRVVNQSLQMYEAMTGGM